MISDLDFTEHVHRFSIVKPTRCTSFSNLFYFGITLHVLDGLSVCYLLAGGNKMFHLVPASKQVTVSV